MIAVSTLIIFGKMHFLLMSENEFFHQIKCDEITSFCGIRECCICSFRHILLKQHFCLALIFTLTSPISRCCLRPLPSCALLSTKSKLYLSNSSFLFLVIFPVTESIIETALYGVLQFSNCKAPLFIVLRCEVSVGHLKHY